MFGLRFLSALGIMKLKEKRMFSCILKKFGENMISYIKGTLERRGENDIIVEAGGIGDGRGMAAAFMLGAVGVQMGTRFLLAEECGVHQNYKDMVKKATDVSTTAKR